MRSGTHSSFRWHVVKHVDAADVQADNDCFGNRKTRCADYANGILCDQLWATNAADYFCDPRAISIPLPTMVDTNGIAVYTGMLVNCT